jgi:hypothetical protein
LSGCHNLQVVRQLRAKFAKYDRDNSGLIDAAELDVLMRDLGFTLSRHRLATLARELSGGYEGEHGEAGITLAALVIWYALPGDPSPLQKYPLPAPNDLTRLTLSYPLLQVRINVAEGDRARVRAQVGVEEARGGHSARHYASAASAHCDSVAARVGRICCVRTAVGDLCETLQPAAHAGTRARTRI